MSELITKYVFPFSNITKKVVLCCVYVIIVFIFINVLDNQIYLDKVCLKIFNSKYADIPTVNLVIKQSISSILNFVSITLIFSVFCFYFKSISRHLNIQYKTISVLNTSTKLLPILLCKIETHGMHL